MLRKFLSKYILEVIPSILATVVGAYIVTHYINNKPDADKPQAAMASPTNPASPTNLAPSTNPAKAPDAAASSKPVKPDESAQAEKAAKAEAAKVKAAEKAAADKVAAEKLASEKAATEKLAAEKAQAEKAEKAAEAESRRAREKAVAKSAPVTPPAAEANAAPDDKRDANDLARAAIERLRSSEQPRQAEQPRAQEAARAIEPSRPQERKVNSVVYTPPSALQPLPPAVTVAPAPSEAEVMAPPARSPAPRSTEAQVDDSMRLTPPADIPSRPIDLHGGQERSSVAEDVVSAAKSVFQAVVPR
jgi:hypothetical protein